MPRNIRQLWWRASLMALACAPTVAIVWRAHAAAPPMAKQVLARLVADPNVLVNVGASDMPASPDILELGRRSTAALARCLADNADARLRAGCGDMIGVLGDASGLPALHAALEDWDESVRLHAMRSLGRIADVRSVPPLLAAWKRSDETRDNRLATLRALGSIASPPALAFLRQVMCTPVGPGAADLRSLAFAELWRNRRLMRPAAIAGDLEHALRGDNQRMIYAAAVRAATLRSPRLVPALLSRIDDAHEDTRNKVIRALGLVGDRRAEKALLERIGRARDARLLNNLAFALERVDRPAFFKQVEQLVHHKQAVIRLNAAFIVGDVRRPEGARLLARALSDPSDRVRHEAASAAAKLPTPTPLLLQALGDRDVGVRLRAASAAAELGDEAALRRAFSDEDVTVRLTAVRGAASVRSPAVLLGAAMRDREEGVRGAALDVATRHESPPLSLITAGLGDASVAVRRSAIAGVTRHKIAAAVPALLATIDDARSPLREDAIYAAAAAAPGGRADRVYELLFAKGDTEQRQRAALALAARGDARVHDYIAECLLLERCAMGASMPVLRNERDPSIIRRVELAWIRKRVDLEPLIVALRPPGTVPLALAQLETASDRGAVLRSLALLVQLGDPAARPVVAARLASSDLWLRMRLDAALDRLGAADARQRLMAPLDSAPLGWMPEVASVLGQIEEPAQRSVLEAEVARREASPEFPRALAAAAVRLTWHDTDAPPRLLEALASPRPREREQARRYLRAAPEATLERAAAGAKDPAIREELERLAGHAG